MVTVGSGAAFTVSAAGPPPLPLRRYPVRVQNGDVQIQTEPIPIIKH